jgi:hypothetical protein
MVLDVLNQTLNEMNWSGQAKTYLELAFLKITAQEAKKSIEYLNEIERLKTRVKQLEIDINQPNFNQDLSVSAPKQENLALIEESDSEEDSIKVDDLEEIKIKDDDLTIDSSPKEDLKTEIKKDMCDDISKTYDIQFVEEVLNNGDIKDRKQLNEDWSGFERGILDKDEKYLASLLESGQVVASNKHKLIITFASATICNKLMMPKNKDLMIKILSNKFNRNLNYMALPVNVFEEITQEFKEVYKTGADYIHLSQIFCEGLKDVSQMTEKSESEQESKIVSDAKQIFGDLVRIKQ